MSSIIKAASLLQRLYVPRLLKNQTAAATHCLLRLNQSTLPNLYGNTGSARTLCTSLQLQQHWRDINNSQPSLEDSWACDECNFRTNFANRRSCYRCEAPNPNPPPWTPKQDRPSSSFDRGHQGGNAHANGGFASFEGHGQSFSLDNVVSLEDKKGAWSKQFPPNMGTEKKMFNKNSNYGSGINFAKYEDIPVSATGEQVPDCINAYADVELGKIVEDNITLCGHTLPTPVQKYSIPILKQDLDMMTCSQTGSGKTAAFLVPIISNITENGPFHNSYTSAPGTQKKAYPVCLIMAPTRELVSQIYEEALKLTYRSSIRCAAVYGGANISPQISSLLWGGNLVVATPGRLLDLVARGTIGLESVRYLVLDEADRMLDMGFEPQIRQVVEKNGMPGKADRITSMFSATFAKDIQTIARDFLRPSYVFLSVGRVGSASENITQRLLQAHDRRHKNDLLLETLQDVQDDKVLIFANTKKVVDSVARDLRNEGFQSVSIHGDHTQAMREASLRKFKQGHSNILVGTDVASRGLDIPNVKMVINFDLPIDGIDAYVHRIGRTGRAGHTGEAVSFFNNDFDTHMAQDLVKLLEETGQEPTDFLGYAAKFSGRGKSNSRGGGGRGGGMGRNMDNRGFNNNNRGGGSYNNRSYNEPNQHQQGGNRYQQRGDDEGYQQPAGRGFNRGGRGGGFRNNRMDRGNDDADIDFFEDGNDRYVSRSGDRRGTPPSTRPKWNAGQGNYGDDDDDFDDDAMFDDEFPAQSTRPKGRPSTRPVGSAQDQDSFSEFDVDEENYKKFIKNRIK